MAISKISTKGMSGDTLDAGDIAPNAIGASELADNAVDTAAIAATSITEAKLNADVTDGSAIATSVKPHIEPGVLHPAVRGMLLDEGDASSFTDSSASGRGVTTSGLDGIYHNPASTKPANTSHKSAITTDGGTTKLSTPNSADFAFGTGDFTIELWARRHDSDTCGLIQMFSDANNRWQLSHYGSLSWYSNVGGSSIDNAAAHGADTNWHHYAVVGDDSANTLTVYRDGTLSSQTTSFTQNMSVSAGTIYFGTRTDNGSDFTTYSANLDMNMIRIVKGTAVYTGNFVAPTALTATGGTYSSTTNVVTSITAGHTKVLINSDVGNSGAYGTAQADGLKYYYTDIKGSKPIKDPRIGSHFGSQRYRMSSIQKLEQETATHGNDVYSVDGREWFRWANVLGDGILHYNNDDGDRFQLGNGVSHQSYIEITGYFSDATLCGYTINGTQPLTTQVDGATAVSNNGFSASCADPKRDRYVNPNTLVNLSLGATLGIHTLRINSNAKENAISGIELIAQDTTSPTTKEQIQIQPQNVVSYGKRFAIDDTALHYNPFAFKTDGSTAWASAAHNGTSWPVGTGSSHNIDTATSLGLDKWLHSSNYYKPYNGGRVVIWVDSSGNIKTSVTVMPPNARSILTSAITAKANASVANNTYLPTFEAGNAAAYESAALAEVAKTFHWREFGNGSANGNNSYRDYSTLNGSDTTGRAYVMDDGLTSLSSEDPEQSSLDLSRSGASDYHYLTFIGTGITIKSTQFSAAGTYCIAQNLPYGTHILKLFANASTSSTTDWTVDGIAIGSTALHYLAINEATFHQPKMPPIPDDAVVIADYMLMADFVAVGAEGGQYISKGVRSVNCSRDHFYNAPSALSGVNINSTAFPGLNVEGTSTLADNATGYLQLPYFGKEVVYRGYQPSDRLAGVISIDGSTISSGLTRSSTAAWGGYISGINTSGTIGSHVWKGLSLANKNFSVTGSEIASHIHTSSHYQTFQTSFLRELVGGDRNMEQTNLVVTPDGKTWDEVTRDASYIGQTVLNLNGSQGAHIDTNVAVQWKLNRGKTNHHDHFIKDSFVMAFDRVICLISGEYVVSYATILGKGVKEQSFLEINGTACTSSYTSYSPDHSYFRIRNEFPVHLKRGDYIQVKGGHWSDTNTQHSQFSIIKLR